MGSVRGHRLFAKYTVTVAGARSVGPSPTVRQRERSATEPIRSSAPEDGLTLLEEGLHRLAVVLGAARYQHRAGGQGCKYCQMRIAISRRRGCGTPTVPEGR